MLDPINPTTLPTRATQAPATKPSNISPAIIEQHLEPDYALTSTAIRHRIIEGAIQILEETGLLIKNEEAKSVLHGAGALVDKERVCLKEALIHRALKTAPHNVLIYDRYGNQVMDIGGSNIYFTPGSTAEKILDFESGNIRTPTTKDLIAFAQLIDTLPYYTAQSTGLVSDDVPQDIKDSYRLYIALLHSQKPIITGTFRKESFKVMNDMLAIVTGNKENLRKKPLAIFDCCPSSPLTWGDDQTQSLINCARAGIPVEIIPAPLMGATAPVTLIGAATQHCAENLGGLVIHQLTAPDAPIIYGGCGMSFDMRYQTPLSGAAETMLLQGACAEVGKHLRLPTHGYMGQSDSKLPDYQAGMETIAGLITAMRTGINNISGLGMLENLSCQSLEKLVLDHEACGMAMRLRSGITQWNDPLLLIINEGIKQREFLSLQHTVERFRKELFFPSAVIDRTTRDEWQTAGSKDAWQRARDRVQELLASHTPTPLPENIATSLTERIEEESQKNISK